MTRRTLFWSLAAAAALFAMAWAFLLRWTCDDAYISFRYAQHLVEGHGLVFNLDPAEPPVEGYSNFLWTMWLALGMALGCTGDKVEMWSIVWGTLCHGATVVLLAWAAWRISARALVPVAAIGFALHHHAASLAPAGLETALFVLLMVAMAVGTIGARSPRHGLVLGCLGVLAAMTRPDGSVPVAVTGAFLLLDALRTGSWRALLAFAAPFALAFLPYLLWRHAYYGQWVPNTYFAKSGGEADWGRGLVYLREYVKVYWPLVPAALLLVAPFAGAGGGPVSAPWSLRRAAVVLVANVALYVIVIARVGGDFMFARFLLPVTPLCLLGADLAAAKWRSWLAVPLALLIGTGFLLRPHPEWLDHYLVDKNPYGVSDNRAISMKTIPAGPGRDPIPLTEVMRFVGQNLQGLFAGIPDLRIGIGGSQANLAYRTRVPVAIECASGLTDAYIAHLPLAHRGPIGHERPWTMYPDYLVRSKANGGRGVQIMFELSFKTGSSADPYRDIIFPVIEAKLVSYQREVMAAIRQRDPNVSFRDFEKVLDDYIARMPGRSKDVIQRDFAGFKDFYFDHNDDAARLKAFTEALK